MLFENTLESSYPTYSILDRKTQKTASAIAAKYPCSIEHVAKVLVADDFNEEETERYIMRELVQGRFTE